MMQRYRAFVEAAVDNVISEGGAHRLPLDTLARAQAQGFDPDTFEQDVIAEAEARATPADPNQTTLDI